MPTPAEILSQMKRPAHWKGWVPTFSGTGYRPWDDDPGPLSWEDLTYGLAHTFRYGGQSHPAITVAEHCVLVSEIIERLWPGRPELVKAGFLHDAAESVLHDIQGPLRSRVLVRLDREFITWNESDLRVTTHIASHFGVSGSDLTSPEVRAADLLAVSFEKRDCKNLDGDWGLPPIPDEVQDMKIRFLGIQESQLMFIRRGTELGLWLSPT